VKNLLIDGNNLVNAAYCVIFKGDEPTEDKIKEVVNLFNRMIINLETKFSPCTSYIAWDGPRSSFWRKSLSPEYKATRGAKHPVLISTLAQCKINGYKNIMVPYAEGDDVIGVLSSVLKGDNIVVSSDKDFIQLLQKGRINQLYNFIQKTFREAPDHDIILEKAIVGDGSDNIKGIPGIGIKGFLKHNKNNFVNLTEEQKKIIERNCTIIDLDKNPNLIEITQCIIDILSL